MDTIPWQFLSCALWLIRHCWLRVPCLKCLFNTLKLRHAYVFSKISRSFIPRTPITEGGEDRTRGEERKIRRRKSGASVPHSLNCGYVPVPQWKTSRSTLHHAVSPYRRQKVVWISLHLSIAHRRRCMLKHTVQIYAKCIVAVWLFMAINGNHIIRTVTDSSLRVECEITW